MAMVPTNTVSIGTISPSNKLTIANTSGTISIDEDALKRLNLNELEYAVRGEMIVVQKVMSDLDYFEMESKLQMKLPEVIKRELVYNLAEQLMESNKILFTSQTNPSTMERTFRASIYATSDNNVRILKEFKKRNT